MVQNCEFNYHNILFAVDKLFIDIPGRLSFQQNFLHCCWLSCMHFNGYVYHSSIKFLYFLLSLYSGIFTFFTFYVLKAMLLSSTCNRNFYDCTLIFITYLKFLFLLSDKHNCMYLMYLVYLILLHVLAVQMSHHQVRQGYTKAVKGRGLSLHMV